jgi:suppressor of fused-like protein
MANEMLDYLKQKHGGQEPQSFLSAIPGAALGNLTSIHFWKDTTPQPHWHFVTEGFGEWGFELTLRLASKESESQPPQWPARFFNELFAYVNANNEAFKEEDYMEFTNGPLDADVKTEMTGAVFVKDEELGVHAAKEGEIIFLQTFPLFPTELVEVKGDDYKNFITRLKKEYPGLIADIGRTPLI